MPQSLNSKLVSQAILSHLSSKPSVGKIFILLFVGKAIVLCGLIKLLLRRLFYLNVRLHLSVIWMGCVLNANADNLLRVDHLYSHSDLSSVTISPDGQLMTFYGRVDGRVFFGVYEISSDTLVPVLQPSDGDELYVIRASWADSNSLLISTSRFADSPLLYWAVDVERKNGMSVKARKARAKGIVLDTLSGKEDRVLFHTKHPRNHNKSAIYEASLNSVVNATFYQEKRLKPLLKDAIEYKVDNANLAFAKRYDEDTHDASWWYLYEKKWRLLFEYDPREYVFLPLAILEGGEKVLVASNTITDKVVVQEFDVKKKKVTSTIYKHPKYDVSGVTYDHSEKRLVAVSYFEAGEYQLEYILDEESKTHERIRAALPNHQFQIVASSEDRSRMVLRVFASNMPPRFVLFDKSQNTLFEIGPSYIELEKHDFVETKQITVETLDGLKIDAFLTRPQNGNGVLLLNPHGGPIGIQDALHFNRETQFYANRGFSVLNVNFRGSGGYGKRFEQGGVGQWGQAIEDDILAALRAIEEDYAFEKVCAIGASYGAYSSLMLAAREPDEIDCAVGRFGVYDLALLFNSDNLHLGERYRKALTHVLGPYENLTSDTSPVYRAKEIKVPVLLTAGVEDEIADLEHTNRMKHALVQSGNIPDIIYYPTSEHGHDYYFSSEHELAYIDYFLRKTLNLPTYFSESHRKEKIWELKHLIRGFKRSRHVESNSQYVAELQAILDEIQR